jgi:PAS domain-containing protein
MRFAESVTPGRPCARPWTPAPLTPLGFFTSVNPGLAAFLGFSLEHLNKARIIDLVATADRPEFTRALNALVGGHSRSEVVEATFLTRDHGRQTMRMGLAPVMRDLACTGVMFCGYSPDERAVALAKASA